MSFFVELSGVFVAIFLEHRSRAGRCGTSVRLAKHNVETWTLVSKPLARRMADAMFIMGGRTMMNVGGWGGLAGTRGGRQAPNKESNPRGLVMAPGADLHSVNDICVGLRAFFQGIHVCVQSTSAYNRAHPAKLDENNQAFHAPTPTTRPRRLAV